MIIRFFIVVLFFIATSACTTKELTPDELRKFVIDDSNGLTQTVLSNGYAVTCQYQPTELVFASEILLEPKTFIQKRDSLRGSKLLYFKLGISRGGKDVEHYFAKDFEKYKELVSYLSFELGNEVDLICERDTVSISDFIYTPMYGMSETTNILLAFEVDPQFVGNIKLIYSSSFFSFGRLEFLFKSFDIRNAPTISQN